MPHVFYDLLSLVEARPMESVAVTIAAILYMRLMMSGPRAH
jgi:hypothetical protein